MKVLSSDTVSSVFAGEFPSGRCTYEKYVVSYGSISGKCGAFAGDDVGDGVGSDVYVMREDGGNDEQD